MISEVMNSSIPRTGLLIPPSAWLGRTSCWARTSASGVAVVIVRPSVRGCPAVPGVEHRALRADLGQVVEVVRRRRGGGGPLEGVALPRVVAGRLAAAQR